MSDKFTYYYYFLYFVDRNLDPFFVSKIWVKLKWRLYLYIHIYTAQKVEKQWKKFRKQCEAAMYWNKIYSTRVAMRNTKKDPKIVIKF